jgi:PAS domain S-box-containing protein
VNNVPLQLELALQTGQVVPWEYDPVRRELSWYESSDDGAVQKTAAIGNWIQKVHPEDQSLVFAALDKAAQTGYLDFQYRLFSPTGNLHRIRAKGRSTADNETAKIVGITIDLSDRQKAKLQLQTQQAVTKALEEWTTLEELISRVLQVLSETQEWDVANMWSYDPGLDCLVLFQTWGHAEMEPAAQAMGELRTFARGVGLPGQVWESGKPIWIPDVTKEQKFVRSQAEQGHRVRGAFAFPVYLGEEFFGVMEFFTRHARKENSEVAALLNAVGSQLGQVIERRRTERELRESEERHRTVSETASDAILTIDAESTIIFANPAVEQVFGYSVDELLGKPLTTLMPKNLQPDHFVGLDRYLKTGAKQIPWKGVEMLGRNKSGKELQLELSFGEFQKNGKRFFTGVVRDISSRKQAESALKSSEKLAATGRLAASMAHEINNPLTSVTNILYLLNLDPGLTGPNRRLIHTAQQEIYRVSHIVKQTLGFYRESNEPVETDLAEIVDGVLELFANQIKTRSIHVTRQYRVTQNIKTMPGELRQVVSNLIENAIQAARDEGCLVVRLANSIELRNSNLPGVRLTVSDNGSGISPENQKRVFEPFFTTKGERGTGLGLWVTRGIIEKHGGNIRLRSSVKPGKSGTSFSVFLPLVSQLSIPKAA